jgi:SAM-dependent methyltransferase
LITHNQSVPSEWVVRFASHIPQKDVAPFRVLDYACGFGRHALYLQGVGHTVLALDRDLISLQGLQNNLDVGKPFPMELRCIDLEQEKYALEDENELFAGIIVTNYLYRPHLSRLFDQLMIGGVLIYETFAMGNERYGKPSNPNFLLRENELLDIAMSKNFHIVAFEQLNVTLPKPAVIQRICAVKTQD